jgi:peptidyl-prolyl cis-trans isomerase D
VPRGATAKAFDAALFSMKVGEVAGPIETEFGYHVIQLKAVRGGATKTFDEVRPAIESELKRMRASKRFAELAEQLNNLAYEQSDSLKPAAEALKVNIQQSPWISRKPIPGSPLGGEKFLKAAFSEDVIKNKRNSEVVEVGAGTLIATRLLEHKPAANRPFDEVQAEIRKRLTEEEARKRAVAEGRAKLEKLRRGEDPGIEWGKLLVVSRAKSAGLSEPVLRELFRVDAAKVPAFAGTEDPQAGFRLIRISRVSEPSDVNAEARRRDRATQAPHRPRAAGRLCGGAETPGRRQDQGRCDREKIVWPFSNLPQPGNYGVEASIDVDDFTGNSAR